MRTRVYIDGYNLYYACLKRSPHKWLNVHRLATILLPKNAIDKVRYFTARISARPHDPTQPQRQESYFRALATVPEVEIHFGHFLTHEVNMPLVRERFGKKIILLASRQTRVSGALRPLADFIKQFGSAALVAAQFPDTLSDAIGTITKPKGW